MPQMQLTNKSARDANCPEGEAKVYLFDTQLTGFMLEVRASGGKTFYIRYRDARGVQRQFKIGTAPSLSADDARKQAQKLLGRIAIGDDPSEKREVLRSIPTLASFVADRYMPYIRTYKRSARADDSYLRNHILPQFGDKHLDQITKHDAIEFHHKNRASHLAIGTTNRLMILLRFIFNLAIKWEIPGITENPTNGIPLFEANNARERYLSREEVQRLCVALLESKSPMLRYIVLMLILTGARKHEVLEAKWEDFDFDRRFWRIPMTKAGKSRIVPISDGVLDLLKVVPRIAGSAYLFANPKTLKHLSPITDSWHAVRAKAGLPDVRMHDLRHSFASFLINSGRSLYEVQQLLGHSSIKMTQRYAHLAPSTLLAASNVAADAAGISFPSPPVVIG